MKMNHGGCKIVCNAFNFYRLYVIIFWGERDREKKALLNFSIRFRK